MNPFTELAEQQRLEHMEKLVRQNEKLKAENEELKSLNLWALRRLPRLYKEKAYDDYDTVTGDKAERL